jgi:uncharacterized protein YbjT (DUF2867 family)
MSIDPQPLSVVMVGATGAVGGQVMQTLLRQPGLYRLTLIGRRPVLGLTHPGVRQRKVDDLLQTASYATELSGHDVAICTLGVGQPSQVSREELVRVDRDSVLAFAAACRRAGVRQFELLSAMGAKPTSASFYLRTKGELEEGLKALGFERLSLFQPSVILTPTNRYGWSQGLLLRLMPKLQPLLVGGLQAYRGIEVQRLGAAMAYQALGTGQGVEVLRWPQIMVAGRPPGRRSAPSQ